MTDEKVEIKEKIEKVEASVTEVKEEEKQDLSSLPEIEDNGEVIVIDYLDDNLFDDVVELSIDQMREDEKAEDKVSSDILEQYNQSISDIAQHQIIQGRVIGHNEKEIIFDIGFKSEGIVHRSEYAGMEIPEIGEMVEVYLEKMEDENGQTILSREKAEWLGTWNRLTDLYESGETIVGKIVRRIKGGMVVEIDSIQAFLPGSQLDVHPVQDFDQYIGQEMEFKVVKVNRLRKNIVLSRKALLEDSLKEQRESLLQDIEVGQILEGRAKNITDFGVFIDLGGVDGLLHITDLSWGRVNHPSELVKVGETLNVKVIDYDSERKRISLGLKQLTPHPWESVPEKYPVDTIINGKVVSMTNYGAFLEIEKGVEGLVHISEMSWVHNIHHPSEVVKLGDNIEAKVLSVNSEERKIALGFKQLQPDPWESVEEKFPIGSIHKGVVRNLTQFGAFVELAKGVDGLIHVSDLSWTKVVKHPRDFLKRDEEVEVKILDLSKESRRISLGLRQLTEDPWPEITERFKAGSIVSGKVIRVLEKGIIIQLEMDVEGIIPSRSLPRKDRQEILNRYMEGSMAEGKVKDVRPDDKKVILSAVNIPEAKVDSQLAEDSQLEEKAESSSQIKVENPENDDNPDESVVEDNIQSEENNKD
ncbi:MAG: 30S ribosomal protein S1 [Candidatus Marinimicrobia bacterium]|nr:30S ribosomal protein S1 [Candidatus Neomarinimicrobiota bacterium]MCH8068565.1 30S ribosomal protein S1 [Candidatus Neomarinimicrobiota bacterium]